MKIALLHSGNQGFFPRFYNDLTLAVDKNGDTLRLFVPNTGVNNRRKLPKQIIWGSRINWYVHFHLYRLTGLQDIWSVFSTFDLIRKLKAYSPDVINLHVVNDCNLCMPLLLHFVKKRHLPVVWTFHDVRAMTGRCANFDEVDCDKWKTGCHDCPENNPWQTLSLIDNTRLEWNLRKRWFASVENLTIVTPSEWLAGFVRLSFFKDRNIMVINNGIDTAEFARRQDARAVNIPNGGKKIVLGVAAVWNNSKGLDTMIWLSRQLGDDYRVVVLGKMTEEQRQSVPPKMLCLQPTSSKQELIAVYQRATVFANPTLADNFPTVNIEALGSGVPVVTYKTGGSAECIDEHSGMAVEKGDRQAFMEAIKNVCDKPEYFSREHCQKRSCNFSLLQFEKYVKLYHDVANI